MYAYELSQITIEKFQNGGMDQQLNTDDHKDSEQGHHVSRGDTYKQIKDIGEAITEGARAFLRREYQYLAVFMVLATIVIIILIGAVADWVDAVFTAIAFNIGGATSILCGYIGMSVAVYSNTRTALQAQRGYGPAFTTAFKAGCVMGFTLTSLAVLFLYLLCEAFRDHFSGVNKDFEETGRMFEAVAGYGLGGSSIALFGRVGGGIYTKAADVGADLVGKVEAGIPEDDPRNPAVIADNVGDNVVILLVWVPICSVLLLRLLVLPWSLRLNLLICMAVGVTFSSLSLWFPLVLWSV